MPRAKLVRSSKILRTPRVLQMEGMFQVPPTQRSEVTWEVNLPIEEREWSIGLVVGPSGCGKSTLARELFGGQLVAGYDWPADKSILDGFPAGMPIKEITGLLSSVGFSSPPAWLRPFGVLSNGEQFRVTIARALAENQDLAVIDEFTSVVDRQVARIGSAAIAKTVRARKQKLIAVTCHFDVAEWLQADWQFEPATGSFAWRSLQRRPAIKLKIVRVHRSAWKIFKHHHYLDTNIHRSAQCYVALVDNTPAAFVGVISFPHRIRPGWREHRVVCLPDYQGVGIGNAVSEHIASIYSVSKRYRSVTGSPAMIHHRAKSPLWRMIRPPGAHGKPQSGLSHMRGSSADSRVTASFEWVGPKNVELARKFGLSL